MNVANETLYVDLGFVGEMTCAALAHKKLDGQLMVAKGGKARADLLSTQSDLWRECRARWAQEAPNMWTQDASQRACMAIAGKTFVEQALRLPPTEAEVFGGL